MEEISSDQLTIGDIVCIEAGDVIEGDGRILEALIFKSMKVL